MGEGGTRDTDSDEEIDCMLQELRERKETARKKPERPKTAAKKIVVIGKHCYISYSQSVSWQVITRIINSVLIIPNMISKFALRPTAQSALNAIGSMAENG